MKRLTAILVLILSLGLLSAHAQESYTMPEVKVSTDKVKIDGKVYYSHVVLQKQTLWSICKAYDVTAQDIYNANPTLNLETDGLKANQILLIPTKKLSRKEAAAREAVQQIALFPGMSNPIASEKVQQDTLAISETPADTLANVFVADIPEEINLTILLPFDQGRSTQGNEYDFLCGAMLAARDLGNEGRRIRIQALDVKEAKASSLKNSDVTIGPISVKDIRKVLPLMPAGKFIVSPLDPRAFAMVDTCAVIQAPTASANQVAELMKWIAEDWAEGDALILVKESDVRFTAGAREISESMAASGIPYSTISYGILEGLKIIEQFEAKASKTGTTRFVIASENESFVNDVVRNIDLLLYKKYAVTLYSTAKIRGFATLETENLHEANTKMASNYFIDYDDPRVKKFVLSYRALFRSEPNSFAFQGYDTASYFTTLCASYGREWAQKISEQSTKGLQTDFKFENGTRKGAVNTAVRRVEYKTDYSIVLY